MYKARLSKEKVSDVTHIIGTFNQTLSKNYNTLITDSNYFYKANFKEKKVKYQKGTLYEIYNSEDVKIGYAVNYMRNILIVLFIIVLSLAILVPYTISNLIVTPTASEVVDDIVPGELSTMTYDEKKQALQDIVDNSSVNISLNVTPSYEVNKLNIRYINRDINKYNAKLNVIIDNNTIYTSPLIEPGNSIENCTIDSLDTSSSEISAIVRLDFYTEDGESINSAEVPITILNNDNKETTNEN